MKAETLAVNALVISETDSVAVAIHEMKVGDKAIFKIEEEIKEISILQDIPIYHKFATKDMKAGDLVFKYGQVIGQALEDILAGQHVHTHNVVSIREGIEE
ncbi:UxaA family hydrolase [Clostridium formicaceticum]|uniref:Altronate dehydratase n=1 Tax=Clostridium formicaceticum TaxID=1497 RepID=A0AAC9RQS1_9CLOT|nr:UxaA family hydrolase [Clostridium formicaceticum]AOY75257.1 hydrolase [Clostridium formicaceticum]ARE89692.1 Altronate dehydratase [Clostridium formicaceticum]